MPMYGNPRILTSKEDKTCYLRPTHRERSRELRSPGFDLNFLKMSRWRPNMFLNIHPWIYVPLCFHGESIAGKAEGWLWFTCQYLIGWKKIFLQTRVHLHEMNHGTYDRAAHQLHSQIPLFEAAFLCLATGVLGWPKPVFFSRVPVGLGLVDSHMMSEAPRVYILRYITTH